MVALNEQHGGAHYRELKIQPVVFIMKCQMGFCEGNVIKYVTRWRDKGGAGDLRKARHYLQFLMQASWYQRLFNRIRGALRLPDETMTGSRYIEENHISGAAAGVIRHIWYWNLNGARHELVSAMRWMDEMLAESAKEQVMVCGVDCKPGYDNCNGYCRGEAEHPPMASA